jgi:hypothetical protein
MPHCIPTVIVHGGEKKLIPGFCELPQSVDRNILYFELAKPILFLKFHLPRVSLAFFFIDIFNYIIFFKSLFSISS